MKKLLIGFALLGASTSVLADSLIYGGASVGESEYKGEHGTTYNVHVGTGILPILGLEAGMTKFEEVTVNSVKTEANTVYFAAKPSLDLGPLHVYAKGGLHSWDKKEDGTKVDDGLDIMYGVGAELSVMGPITVGASYQTYEMDGSDMKTYQLNATFHFL
ncbi:porin [Vibrio quintilis]|uniref:OmpA-like transmembrane domain protein n=1 Tax=Vibrio quintilis TaxID=1117707 RepID=A0A1M7Z2B1_9VIBR|nr:porin [Vibrio quintilis]SHO58935.1 OmpA-like transmembrane domain protein [Vibrio quintilis]